MKSTEIITSLFNERARLIDRANASKGGEIRFKGAPLDRETRDFVSRSLPTLLDSVWPPIDPARVQLMFPETGKYNIVLKIDNPSPMEAIIRYSAPLPPVTSHPFPTAPGTAPLPIACAALAHACIRARHRAAGRIPLCARTLIPTAVVAIGTCNVRIPAAAAYASAAVSLPQPFNKAPIIPTCILLAVRGSLPRALQALAQVADSETRLAVAAGAYEGAGSVRPGARGVCPDEPADSAASGDADTEKVKPSRKTRSSSSSSSSSSDGGDRKVKFAKQDSKDDAAAPQPPTVPDTSALKLRYVGRGADPAVARGVAAALDDATARDLISVGDLAILSTRAIGRCHDTDAADAVSGARVPGTKVPRSPQDASSVAATAADGVIGGTTSLSVSERYDADQRVRRNRDAEWSVVAHWHPPPGCPLAAAAVAAFVAAAAPPAAPAAADADGGAAGGKKKTRHGLSQSAPEWLRQAPTGATGCCGHVFAAHPPAPPASVPPPAPTAGGKRKQKPADPAADTPAAATSDAAPAPRTAGTCVVISGGHMVPSIPPPPAPHGGKAVAGKGSAADTSRAGAAAASSTGAAFMSGGRAAFAALANAEGATVLDPVVVGVCKGGHAATAAAVAAVGLAHAARCVPLVRRSVDCVAAAAPVAAAARAPLDGWAVEDIGVAVEAACGLAVDTASDAAAAPQCACCDAGAVGRADARAAEFEGAPPCDPPLVRAFASRTLNTNVKAVRGSDAFARSEACPQQPDDCVCDPLGLSARLASAIVRTPAGAPLAVPAGLPAMQWTTPDVDAAAAVPRGGLAALPGLTIGSATVSVGFGGRTATVEEGVMVELKNRRLETVDASTVDELRSLFTFTFAAFANNSGRTGTAGHCKPRGGVLLLGVSDDGTAVGVVRTPAAVAAVASAINASVRALTPAVRAAHVRTEWLPLQHARAPAGAASPTSTSAKTSFLSRLGAAAAAGEGADTHSPPTPPNSPIGAAAEARHVVVIVMAPPAEAITFVGAGPSWGRYGASSAPLPTAAVAVRVANRVKSELARAVDV